MIKIVVTKKTEITSKNNMLESYYKRLSMIDYTKCSILEQYLY